MKLTNLFLSVSIIFVFLATALCPTPASAQGDAPGGAMDELSPEYLQWLRGYHINGVDGTVYAMAVDPGGSGLYIGGEFTIAGGTPKVNYIARWNGSAWEPLSGGMNGVVRALLFDGLGNLYAGGLFNEAGFQWAPGLARYKLAERSWEPLGDALLYGVVYALAYDAANARLYVGGDFYRKGALDDEFLLALNTAANTWSEVGGVLPGNIVYALLYSPTSGRLYAGGTFTSIGAAAIARIGYFDGTNWKAMGSGAPSAVRALAEDAVEHVIYVGGEFNSIGGVSNVGRVARWDADTSAWSAMESGFSGTVRALSFVSPYLYVGGTFQSFAGGGQAERVAVWNEGIDAWSTLGTLDENGMKLGTVYAVLAQSSGVFVGGGFLFAGTVPANSVALWSGGAWHLVDNNSGRGTFGTVRTVRLDAAGMPYIGGQFMRAGTLGPANSIARWDAVAGDWTGLGTGLRNAGDNASVYDIAFNGSHVYAGGAITEAGGTWDSAAQEYTGGVAVNDIAHWDGTAWTALGDGLNGTVQTLEVDGSGSLYAGGDFTWSGALSLNYIGKWNGTAWSALGSGTVGVDDKVYALKFDGSGNLLVGGCFSAAGGVPANNIALYAPATNTWSALGSGTDGCVYAIAVDGLGNVYAGGSFSEAGGISANNIAKYTPGTTTWSMMGAEDDEPGINNIVRSLAVDAGGRVYAAGDFSYAGETRVRDLARWNGLFWEAVGIGEQAVVVLSEPAAEEEGVEGIDAPQAASPMFYDIALDSNPAGPGYLYIGGTFSMVGDGLPSRNFAVYTAGHNLVTMVSPANGTIFESASPIRLTWNAYPGANRYQVELYRGQDMKRFKALRASRPYLTLSKTALPLLAGPTYWRVRPFRGGTPVGGWSGLWTLYTVTPAEKLTYPLNRARKVDLSPRFEWGAPPGLLVDHYEFELATDARFKNRVWTAWIEGDPLYYLPIVLQAKKTYFWRTRYLLKNGQVSLWSPTFRFITRP